MKKVLITGTAGFIGFHLSKRLLKEGWQVIGFDNLNNYYDVNLKKARLEILEQSTSFSIYKISLEDQKQVADIFASEKPDVVVNLAAQAGVRYSIENPYVYTKSNIDGFLNILEGCRHHEVKHLIYASSSSVYGANKDMPFSVSDHINHPLSLYAATKEPMSSWHIPILTCIICLQLVYDFSQSMAHGDGRTWRCFFLPGPSSTENRSRSSTTGRCSGILPISMI